MGRQDRARMPRGRLVVLLAAGVALLAGLDAALLRLGVTAPVAGESLALLHGPLMIFGFVGTAITLERAVALRSGARSPEHAWWGFASPVAAGAGAALAILGASPLPVPGGRLLPGVAWTISTGVLAAIYLAVWRRQQSYAVLVQALGAFAGIGGAALWARGFDTPQLVAWWAGMLVLTIVGERLELARVAFVAQNAGGPRTEARILAESCVVVVALVASLLSPAWGYPLLGAALGVLVLDVAWHDVARRTIRAQGLVRFVAASMLAGYVWAMVPVVVWTVHGPVFSGYGYDAVVHSLTIGFVLSMIMAHAPVIVPAVVRSPLPYHPVMWAVWGLLQGGLLVRVVAGAREAGLAWQIGGTLSVVALLAFLVTMVSLVSSSRRRARSGTSAAGTSAAQANSPADAEAVAP
jgi:hypothetical protein